MSMKTLKIASVDDENNQQVTHNVMSQPLASQMTSMTCFNIGKEKHILCDSKIPKHHNALKQCGIVNVSLLNETA